MLTRDQILAKKDIKTVTLHIPEWDDDVIVSEMTGKMRDQFERSWAVYKNKGEDDQFFRAL